MKCSECKFSEYDYGLSGYICHNEYSQRHLLLADSGCTFGKYIEPVDISVAPTNVFADKSKDAITVSDIRNKAYSTLVSIKYALDTFEEILSSDPSKDQIVCQNLYHVREDMLNLLALTYDINIDDEIKISSLITLVNQSLAENSETDTLPVSLHEALSNLSNK